MLKIGICVENELGTIKSAFDQIIGNLKSNILSFIMNEKKLELTAAINFEKSFAELLSATHGTEA